MQRSLNCFLTILVVAGVALVASHRALAHQQQEALTTVLFNERTGNIDVMHRFYIHDAEHVVSKLSREPTDILASESAQKTFGQYVAEHFELRIDLQDNRHKNMPLTYIGQEVDGKFLWIYQQSPIPSALRGQQNSSKSVDENTYGNFSNRFVKQPLDTTVLAVRHSALQEFWSQQRNVVNIEFQQQVKTLIFRVNDDWQSAKLY